MNEPSQDDGRRKDMSYSRIMAERNSSGVKCPDCGCPCLPVYGTRREGNRHKRYRRCSHCGKHPIITYEQLYTPKGSDPEE